MTALWRGADGRPRAVWRLGLWLAAVAATLAGLGSLAVARLPPAVALAVRAAAVVAVSLAAWRVLEGRPPAATPLTVGRGALARVARGLAVGVALVVLAVGVLAAAGAFRIAPRACAAADQGVFALRLLALFLAAGALEEILFRGYPLFTLRAGAGSVPAVAATSVVFSLAHAVNPHYDAAAMAVITGIGAVLAVVVLEEGSVWGAAGVHAGWNWGLGAVAGLPVSGLAFPAPCWVGIAEGPEWMTGGGFGLEASLPAAAAWALLGLARLRR